MARLPTKLECPDTQVEPGQLLRCRLLVYNAAERVDEVRAEAGGPLAEWVTVDPAQLALMPETEGAFAITIDVPRDARLVAGEHPLMVEASSGLEGTEPSIEEQHLEVSRVTGASLAVHPAPSPADEGTYEVVVDSRANHPLDLTVEASAPVPVEVGTPKLALAPFGRGATALRVDARSLRAPIAVQVAATGDHLELRSELTHVPRAPEPPPSPAPAPAPAPAPGPSPSPTPEPPSPGREPEPGPQPCMNTPLLLVVLAGAAGFVAWSSDSERLLRVVLVVGVALWLLFGYAGCRIMASKRRGRWAGWALGLLLTGVGLLVAAVLPERRRREVSEE